MTAICASSFVPPHLFVSSGVTSVFLTKSTIVLAMSDKKQGDLDVDRSVLPKGKVCVYTLHENMHVTWPKISVLGILHTRNACQNGDQYRSEGRVGDCCRSPSMLPRRFFGLWSIGQRVEGFESMEKQ